MNWLARKLGQRTVFAAQLVATFFALSVTADALAEVEFELDAEVMMAYGTDATDIDQSDLVLQPSISFDLGATRQAVVSVRSRWSGASAVTGADAQLSTYSKLSAPWQQGRLRLELRDAYLDQQLGDARLRLGKQQIVWGALDGLKLLDAINPMDFREFILDDFDESRISQWAMHLEYPLAGGYLELAVVPDTSAHELPPAGTKFAFSAPRFRFGLDTVNAGVRQQPVHTVPVKRSGKLLRDGTYGLRYSRFVGGWDLAFSVVTGQDHRPVGVAVPADDEGVALEQQYRQRTIVGVSTAKSFGPVALRTELAVRPNRAFNQSSRGLQDLGIVRRDQISGAIALDWQAPLGLFINLQLLHEQILNHNDRLAAPKADTLATMLVRRRFLYDTLTTELRWYGNLADNDGLVRSSIAYQIDDNTLVQLGADVFYGSSDGIFGEFAETDQVSVTLRRVF